MSDVIVLCKSCGTKNRVPEKKQHLTPICGKCGASIDVGDSAVPVQLGDSDFQQFIHAVKIPVMVDFFAPTCGPCQALAPIISKLAGHYVGRIVIGKVDTSLHPGTAAHYQIRGVPSLLFFRNGQVVDQLVGAPPEHELISRLDEFCRGE